MLEPAPRIGSGDGRHRLGDSFKQSLVCPSADAPERGLQLGEGLFNRREIGPVDWQKTGADSLWLQWPAARVPPGGYSGYP